MLNGTDIAAGSTIVIKRAYWWYVVLASCLGILMNVYCVIVLTRLRRHNARFTLLVIAFADILALCLIFGRHVWGVPRSEQWASVFCKCHTFLLHCASSYSVWCWVLWSVVRYMAVFHPYEHRRLRKCNNSCGLLSLLCTCLSTESWILVTVESDKNGRCIENIDFINETTFRLINLTEVLAAYIIPFACVVVTSVAVFSRIYLFNGGLSWKRHAADRLLSGGDRRRSLGRSAAIHSESRQRRLRQRQFRSLVRLIVLVVVSLTLNLPHCAVRLLNTYNPVGTSLLHNEIIQKISFTLSYTHYTVNCLYLRLVIDVPRYKRATAPRSSEETFSRIRTA